MKITSLSFDLAQFLAIVGWVLLLVGVLPFTAAAVGALGIASTFELKWTVRR